MAKHLTREEGPHLINTAEGKADAVLLRAVTARVYGLSDKEMKERFGVAWTSLRREIERRELVRATELPK